MLLEPLAEICVADSRFLGFCFQVASKEEAVQHQLDLKREHPDAAHVAVVWRLPNNDNISKNGGDEGFDEDGEPPIGAAVLEALHVQEGGDDGAAVVIVRYFGSVLLGVTCGRLPQCYQSIIRLSLHRYDNNNTTTNGNTPPPPPPPPPMEQQFLNVKRSMYGLAAGDTELILDVLLEKENDDDSTPPLVQKILSELDFGGFKGAEGEPLPRLQNLQADLSEDLIPIYRYPGNYRGDEWQTFEWSPTSLRIKSAVESNLLVEQSMNHCVTNYYRDGKDFIQHHSDKDLDLNREGVIVSVSLGDERILELKRRAEPRDVTQIKLPHRSMLVLGPKTNKEFTHSILQKEEEEDDDSAAAAKKIRASLTLRECKTFMDLKSGRMFGAGVVGPQSLQEIRTQQLVEHSVFFGGRCC
jgi:hypothetical protein